MFNIWNTKKVKPKSNTSIVIKGSDLEIIKLDTYQGTVSIKGVIISLTYADSIKKEEGVFSKLFK